MDKIENSKNVAFTFSKDFQEQMLSLMLSDAGFAEKALKVIPEERLFSEAHKWVFKQIKRHIETLNKCPSMLELEDLAKRIDIIKRKLLLRFVKKLLEIKVTDTEFIKEKVTEYARKNLFVQIFQDAQTLWNTGKFDTAYEKVKNGIGLLHSISLKDDANVAVGDFEKLRRFYSDQVVGLKRKIPTMIPILDGILKGGLEKGEMGILLALPKKGKCLAQCSNVVLSNGETATIKDIVEKKITNILSFNEETQKFEKDEVIDWIESGTKDVFEIDTTTSFLKATENHPFLTFDGWKPLKEIEVDEQIFIPKHLPNQYENSISDERLTLLAYMIADGTMNAAWEYSKNEQAIRDEFLLCHNKEFEKKDTTPSGRILPSNEMKQWFKDLGLMGHLAGTKFIPSIVERQNKEKVSLFLNKLFTSDGCAEASGKVSYSSKSLKMINQIISLLLRFDIGTSIKKKLVDGIYYYEIGIQGTNLIKFRNQIGMSHSKKEILNNLQVEEDSKREYVRGFSPELWKLIYAEASLLGLSQSEVWRRVNGVGPKEKGQVFKKGRVSLYLLTEINKVLKSSILQKILDGEWIMTTVRSITKCGKEMTYDIEVRKNHNFIANNIIVHNSQSLTHMGYAGLIQGYKVAHFVLEGMTSQAILRYEARMANVEYNRLEVGDVNPEEESRLERIKKWKDNLILIPFNQHWNYTVLDVEAKIRELERAGNKPDLVVLDYADLLRHHERTSEKRLDQAEVYRDLKRMAMMRDVSLWTASQAKRPDQDDDKEYLLRAKDISEAFEKVRIADFVATLNQTPKEKELGILRLHADIYRSNDTDKTIRLITDFSKSIFYSPKYGVLESFPEWMKRRRS